MLCSKYPQLREYINFWSRQPQRETCTRASALTIRPEDNLLLQRFQKWLHTAISGAWPKEIVFQYVWLSGGFVAVFLVLYSHLSAFSSLN